MILFSVAAVAVGTVGRRAAAAAGVLSPVVAAAAAGSLRAGPAHNLSSLSIIVKAPKLVSRMTTHLGHLI